MLAAETGISVATIARHESGGSYPRACHLEAYGRALGVRFVLGAEQRPGDAPATGFEPVTYRSAAQGSAA